MTTPVLDPSLDQPSALDWWSAQMHAELIDGTPARGDAAEFDIEIFDSAYGPLGMIGDYATCKVKFTHNAVGVGELVLAGDNEFGKLIMSCDETVVPIRVTYNGRHFDSRVLKAVKRGLKGQKTITVTLVDTWAWFHAIMAYPMPLPGFEEAQITPQDLYIGPLRGGIYWYLQRNVWRLQLRTGQCPITLLPYDALHDTSEMVTMQARMVPLDELFTEHLKGKSVQVRARMWIKDRDPQPMPDKITLLESQVIVDVVDRPKTGGLVNTGTIIDSLVNTIGEAIADGIDAVIGGWMPGLADIITDKLKQQELPSCIWSEDSDGILDATVEATHPNGYSAVVGGTSPTWVNKLLQMGVEAGITALLAWAGLIIPGLATALSGVLNDMFLAFMKATDYQLKKKLGKFALPEVFGNGGSGAYTWSGKAVAEKTLFENAGKRRAKVEVVDWAPFGAFEDFDTGHLVGWEDSDEDDTLFDRVHSIEVEDTREDRVKVTSVIGDDEPDKMPGQLMGEKIARLFSFVNAAAMAMN
ncbi:hypothetical protein P3H15_27185 [Rhodococcus sp. T2V]|uniref:Gp37-like protein n=1 Tax=Rhodococcus sp. T2V TaxID=3034164 RepID=UPI0023E18F30|nr:hypothetical protein [Rhodococcus sp. T2V]MDF3308706.1 hypothetical protein [Rhodococcus sp. T2V]